jgi:hypothetical protein
LAQHQIHEAFEITTPIVFDDQPRILVYHHVRTVGGRQDHAAAGPGSEFIAGLHGLIF